MTNDTFTHSGATDTAMGDTLIQLGTGRGAPVEMTRDAKAQLEREMARELDNPLDALMAEVAIEYRQMAPTRADRPFRPL